MTTGDHAMWQMKILDNTLRKSMGGPCQYGWRDGVRAALERRYPDLVLKG